MATKQSNIKKKKKGWYTIQAPETLNNSFLGETTAYSSDELIGKSLRLNLSNFTNDMRKQNTDVKFRVLTVVDNKAITEITGVFLTTAYVKRLVRRGRTKIDDSFLVRSKDSTLIRIKPIIITNAKTNRSVSSRLRLELRAVFRKFLKNTDAKDFFLSIIFQRIQKDIKDKLSKIYPLKYVDVRQALFEVEKGSKKVEEVTDEDLKAEAATDKALKAAAKEESEDLNETEEEVSQDEQDDSDNASNDDETKDIEETDDSDEELELETSEDSDEEIDDKKIKK